jgi:hypothetical protein
MFVLHTRGLRPSPALQIIEKKKKNSGCPTNQVLISMPLFLLKVDVPGVKVFVQFESLPPIDNTSYCSKATLLRGFVSSQ